MVHNYVYWKSRRTQTTSIFLFIVFRSFDLFFSFSKTKEYWLEAIISNDFCRTLEFQLIQNRKEYPLVKMKIDNGDKCAIEVRCARASCSVDTEVRCPL